MEELSLKGPDMVK